MVVATQQQVARYAVLIRKVDATLDPTTHRCAHRKQLYAALERELLQDPDPICQQMGRVMASFQPGLFVGGGRGEWPRDNLELERWFRLPKGHERRIHGRRHAGVRLVQEGATMLLALDAHLHHPHPFTEEELRPYRDAEVPESQREILRRRKVMRAARSTTKRTGLLRKLEERYAALPHP